MLHLRLRRWERPLMFMWVLSCLFDKLLGKLCTFVEGGNRQSHLQDSVWLGARLLRGSVISRFSCRRILSPVLSFCLQFTLSCLFFFLFSQPLTLSSFSRHSLLSSTLFLSPLSYFFLSGQLRPGHGKKTNGTHARVKRPQVGERDA